MSEYVNQKSIKSITYKAVKEQFGFIYYENGSYIAKSDLKRLEENPDKFLVDHDKETGRLTLCLMPL